MDNVNTTQEAQLSRPEGLSPSARAELFNDFNSMDFSNKNDSSVDSLPQLELFDSLPQLDSPNTNPRTQGIPESEKRSQSDPEVLDSLPERDPEGRFEV